MYIFANLLTFCQTSQSCLVLCIIGFILGSVTFLICIFLSLLGSLGTEVHHAWSCFCSSPVRKASANVVSVVAKYAVPAGEWPDLLPFLFQCSQSPQEDHREVNHDIESIFDNL